MPGDPRTAGVATSTPAGWRPRWRVCVTAVVGLAAMGLLLWVAPPDEVIRQIGRMNPAWVIAAVGFELASCLSYVVVFRRFFPEPPRAVSQKVGRFSSAENTIRSEMWLDALAAAWASRES